MPYTLENVIIARSERTMHPDLTCDKCLQQFVVGLKKDGLDWPMFNNEMVEPDDSDNIHVKIVCPELIKVVVSHSGRMVCPKCDEGLMFITKQSRFHPKVLLKTNADK